MSESACDNVLIGNGVQLLDSLLSQKDYTKIFIVADENTQALCVPVLIPAVDALCTAEILETESGEESKDIEIASALWSVLNERNADRSSLIINLGGGVISDLGGFVASTYKRGIRFINIPTTLLAQVDASIGGKTGINTRGLKNMAGTFAFADATIIDTVFLRTLPRRALICGLAEMLKHALIADKNYWNALRSTTFDSVESFAMHIEKSVKIKCEIVKNDPCEQNDRKALNFGHTIGHALESFSLVSGSKVLAHGEAVAIGLICESWISRQKGNISESYLQEICDTILPLFPAFHVDSVDFHRLIELMHYDKKNRSGQFKFVVIKEDGKFRTDVTVTPGDVLKALKFYSQLIS
jgi:3-dehydroquinate synthase